MNARSLATAAGLAAALFAFWVALSGMFTPFLLLAGLGAAVAIAAIALRMEVADPEGYPVRFSVAVVTYWPWLLKEILVSGWRVARIVLDPRLPVSPAMVRFRPSQQTAVGLATHANSITLTPGTITVEAGHDEFVVHALTLEGAAGLAGSEMDRRVRRLEGGA
jgi:multicomponent Na+:H+ antiporter subunit E